MKADRFWGLRARLKQIGPKIFFVGIGIAIGGVGFGILSHNTAVPEAASNAEHAAGNAEKKADQSWTCAMHPQIRQPEPGKCPICGMDLIPVFGDGETTENSGNSVTLSERAKALIALRTEPVRRQGESVAELRLLGRVEADEATLKTVTAWTGGRIDKLQVKVTGQKVRAGQVIATLYSPEVFAAHQDLLSARRQLGRMSQGVPSAQVAAAAAVNASRERLRLLGLPDDEIAALENQSRPTEAVSIRTPFGGTVIERLAGLGAYVTTGTPLYQIADLSVLWVQLDAYERDLNGLAVGQAVHVEIEAFQGEGFEGKIAFIDPTLDERRRTARVRVEVKNRDGRLRPGMFAQAVVKTHRAEGLEAPLTVPSTAPLFTGRRSIVYVETVVEADTIYEPRTVRLGPRLGNVYPVTAGLSEGERIVTRGAFAIDADLQIKGGASMMTLADDREPDRWDGVVDISRSDLRQISPAVIAYLSIQRALAADDMSTAKAAGHTMTDALVQVNITQPKAAEKAWEEIAKALSIQARHISTAKSIEDARAGFEGLSDGVVSILRAFGNPLDQALVRAYCPMAFGSKGAFWIQQGDTIDNAYFGASMRNCGEVKQHIPSGDHLPSTMDKQTADGPRTAVGGQVH